MMTVDYHIAHASLKPRKLRFYGMNSDRSGFISHNHVYLIQPVCWEDGQPFEGNWPKESPVRIFRRPFTLPRCTVLRIEREHRSKLKAAHKALIARAAASTNEEVIREFNLSGQTSAAVAAKRKEWAAMSLEHYLRINEDFHFQEYATPNEKVMGGPDYLVDKLVLSNRQELERLDHWFKFIRIAIRYYNRPELLYASRWRQGPLGPFELDVIKRGEAQRNFLAAPAIPMAAPHADKRVSTHAVSKAETPLPASKTQRRSTGGLPSHKPPPRFSEQLKVGKAIHYACNKEYTEIWLAKRGSTHALRPMMSIVVRALFVLQNQDPGDMVNTAKVEAMRKDRQVLWGELPFSTLQSAVQKSKLDRRIFERPGKGFVRLKLT